MKNENQIALTLEELKRMQEVNKMLDMAVEKEQLKNLEKEKALEVRDIILLIFCYSYQLILYQNILDIKKSKCFEII